MNAALRWAIVDHEGTLVALAESEHFVQRPTVCKLVREALDLSPIFFLTEKTEFSMPEWETWFAFGVPTINMKVHRRGIDPLTWSWERIEP